MRRQALFFPRPPEKEREPAGDEARGDRTPGDMALGCIHFSYEELSEATGKFNNTQVENGGFKLGEGGFGPVYKGTLRHTEVAIKIFRKVSEVGII